VSEAPRTDARQSAIHPSEYIKHPEREVNEAHDFARQLERELTAANAELAAEKARCVQLVDELTEAQSESREQARLLGISGSREAALLAEIERLKKNTGCARNQTTTQFCAEAVDANKLRVDAEWERDKWRKVADGLQSAIERMTLSPAKNNGPDSQQMEVFISFGTARAAHAALEAYDAAAKEDTK
jgi:hypothetical protein